MAFRRGGLIVVANFDIDEVTVEVPLNDDHRCVFALGGWNRAAGRIRVDGESVVILTLR